jgi:hypothetical protein
MKSPRFLLIIGDVLALGIITIIGFATHGETNASFAPRMLTTFIPLLVAWAVFAPWLGLFRPEVYEQPRQAWRAVYAMFLAAPLAVILRAALLNGVALPLFTLILGASAAFGMLIWRLSAVLMLRMQAKRQ